MTYKYEIFIANGVIFLSKMHFPVWQNYFSLRTYSNNLEIKSKVLYIHFKGSFRFVVLVNSNSYIISVFQFFSIQMYKLIPF